MFKPELRDLLHDLPQLIAIAYPKQLEAETLGHAVIAHELAHAVLSFVPAEQEAAPILEAWDHAVTKGYDALHEALKVQYSDEVELDEAAQDAIDRLAKWYDEFACDMLAVGLVGPAYVFALAELDLASDRWAQLRGGAGHDSHPGLAWRLRRAIAQALAVYLPEVREDAPAWSALRTALLELEEDLPDEEDQLTPQERALIEDALANLKSADVISTVLGYAHYAPLDFALGIEIVWEKLAAGIPPAERIPQRAKTNGTGPRLEEIPKTWSSPMDWQSILNGAYAHWYAGRAISSTPREHRTFPDYAHITQDWMEFNAYIRGSIELADLHERLTGVRERLDGLNVPGR